MKRLEIEGFGRLGGQIVDIDLATASDEELLEVGFHNLHDLVTVIQPEHVGDLSLERFHAICALWARELPSGGYDSSTAHDYLQDKYGPGCWERVEEMDDDDRQLVAEMRRVSSGVGHLRSMTRVTGIRDEHGERTGMFADGELDWHANQQGAQHRSPAVGLLAWEGSGGSQTEFLNTVDAYEDLSPEWRRTVDGLVALHRWHPGAVAPGLNGAQDRILQLNMCPEDDTPVPLVQTSPWGHKGMLCAFTTIAGFEGHTERESQEILEYLKQRVLKPRYIYTHDWRDGALIFFDNTVTLHRRPTRDCSRRLMFRVSFNYDHLLETRAPEAARTAV